MDRTYEVVLVASTNRHPVQEVTMCIRAATVTEASDGARKILKGWGYRVVRVTLVQEQKEQKEEA